MRKECDDLEFEIRSLRRQLKGRKDRLIDIKRESEPILTDESPLTQKIRVLENRFVRLFFPFSDTPVSLTHLFLKTRQGHDQVQRGNVHQEDV